MTDVSPKVTARWTLLVMTILLASCGPSREEPATAALPKVELTLITGSQKADLEKQLYASFEEKHPDLTIKAKSWAAWPRQYMTNETPPDLMSISAGDWLFSTIKDDLVADITDVWEQSNLRASYPLALQELTTFRGKQYLLPTGYEWRAIYYNRAIFDKYGLTPPQNWDELLQIADTLVLNGEVPFSLAGRREWDASLWFDYLNIRLNGPVFHQSLIKGEVPFTDERVRTIVLTWQFLFDQGYFIQNHRAYSLLQSVMSISRGKGSADIAREQAVMVLVSSGAVDELPMIFQEELDFFPFPMIDETMEKGEIIGPFGYIVPANAPNRLDALKFLTFAATPQVQDMLTVGVGPETSYVPAHLTSASDELKDEIRRGYELVESAEVVSLPFVWASPRSMSMALRNALTHFSLSVDRGEVNVDEILAIMEEERVKTLSEGGFGE
ncbi:MAG: extracellular solute-binding protein [Chloroflexota bacterium]